MINGNICGKHFLQTKSGNLPTRLYEGISLVTIQCAEFLLAVEGPKKQILTINETNFTISI